MLLVKYVGAVGECGLVKYVVAVGMWTSKIDMVTRPFLIHSNM